MLDLSKELGTLEFLDMLEMPEMNFSNNPCQFDAAEPHIMKGSRMLSKFNGGNEYSEELKLIKDPSYSMCKRDC